MDPSRCFDFSGRTVLVVGASLGGIGSAIAAGFRSGGAAVIITGLEDEPVESERDVYAYEQLDVTDTAAVEALAARTERLDVLVNCAGGSERGRRPESPPSNASSTSTSPAPTASASPSSRT